MPQWHKDVGGAVGTRSLLTQHTQLQQNRYSLLHCFWCWQCLPANHVPSAGTGLSSPLPGLYLDWHRVHPTNLSSAEEWAGKLWESCRPICNARNAFPWLREVSIYLPFLPQALAWEPPQHCPPCPACPRILLQLETVFMPVTGKRDQSARSTWISSFGNCYLAITLSREWTMLHSSASLFTLQSLSFLEGLCPQQNPTSHTCREAFSSSPVISPTQLEGT